MDNNVILIGIAVVNMITAVVSGLTLMYSHRTEKNTNSMKDALVQKTAVASDLLGYRRARLEGEAKAKGVAEGKLESAHEEAAMVGADKTVLRDAGNTTKAVVSKRPAKRHPTPRHKPTHRRKLKE